MAQKTNRELSGLAIDQAHEHANSVVKGDSGAIGFTEDPARLSRWMVCGPDVIVLIP